MVAATACPVSVKFDHADPAISPELFAWGTRMQQESPVAWSETHGGFWLVSGHKDICSIMRNTGTFICAERITLPPQKSPVPVVPLESDEPDHTFYRNVLAPFLTPKAVSQHEAHVRKIVTDALDPLIARGSGDAMSDFAARIPTRAMALVFGFSDEDGYRFDKGFSALVEAAGGDEQQQIAAVDNFKSFLLEKLAEGRASPRAGSLVDAMLKYELKGRRYTEDDQLGLMWSAAGGATDTTKLSIGHIIYQLGVDRALRQKLIDNPALISNFVDESLRLNAPAFVTSRYIATDIEFGGAEMKAGQRVLLVFGWGNRDEATFPDGNTIKLERPLGRHLTFGHGIHTCIGMTLAKMELKVATEELLKRMPNYELANLDEKPIIHGGMMWGYDHLPVKVA